MRYSVLFLILFLASCKVQDVNRYNYIQRPTETGVTIAWVTEKPAIGVIKWGLSADALNIEQRDSASKNKHAFDIADLSPNTKYYYSTTAYVEGSAKIDSFYTAKGETENNFSFFHYGDCGTGTLVQDKIAAQMSKQENIDFGLVAGDVDQGKGNNYDKIFFQKYAGLLDHSCHYTAIGNHDGYYDKAKTYLETFYLPTNGTEEGKERYYTFTWGDAKFICLDSNYGLGVPRKQGVKSEAQEKWLEQELKTNDKKWLFVYFHHPPSTVAWSGDYFLPLFYFLYKGSEKKEEKWMKLFDEYNVDFVLTGHSHCYQKGDYRGTRYILSGGAGTRGDGFFKGIDRIHIRRDSAGNKIPKEARKSPKKGVIVAGKEVEEYYDVKGIVKTVDVLIRQSQFVRFDVIGDTVRYTAFNAEGQIIDIDEKTKRD
jgi:hypothetical protein